MRSFGTHALISDPQLYARWNGATYSLDTLDLLCSKHVDDLKGASSERVFDELCKKLSTHFGELTMQKRRFEHLGTLHVQNDDFSVACTQDHYVKRLRLISTDSLPDNDDEVITDPDLTTSYSSLIGGAAWSLITRSDVAVHIGHLQRHSHAPRVQDFKALNTVVRWMKRRPCTLLHIAIPPPWTLLVLPDSAFKATEPDCLATRACVILLTSTREEHSALPNGGPVGVVEFYSRKQPRVCRSTLSTELFSVNDASSSGLLIRGMFAEIVMGPMTASVLAQQTES